MPKRVDHEERRSQIAEAVVRIAASRGLHTASMREVAAEAGVSLRLVQYYFHTKEELLRGTLKHLGGQIVQLVTRGVAALGEPATPRTFLYGTLTALIPVDDESRRIMLAYAAHYTLTLTQPELAPDGLAYANALQDHVAGQIRQAQKAGQISAEEDPGTAAAIVLALVTGLQSSVLAGQRDGRSAVTLLTAHLDRLFSRREAS
ncbi:TetR/AcrR family transcriptional regulator [Streptosporangium sp. 'caverna']|uniref:TetR/AcrR family transcriptional regulator n=1 Tax=Streptosporangium sp. 'caverna' TaxID=2202249 RepID=UPI000D7E2988|nr:TetR/AcrR family transcriptional regulator [Streptosporangium sp. 'caverna']AWS43015.1 TetR family transcriptional regulator [Streptosporangium sp. 'caverna']